MRKNILFVVPTWSLGGTERVNVALANELSKKYNVSIYTLSTAKQDLFSTEIKVEGRSTAKYNNLLKVSGLLGLLKLDTLNKWVLANHAKNITSFAINHKIDTIILSGPSILLSPAIKKQNPSRKVISWCHNSYSRYFGGYLRYTTHLLAKGLSASDEVVCLTKQDLEGFSQYNEKTLVINNPLTIYPEKQSNLNNKIISWTGRLDNPHKGLDYLAEIAGRLPDGWRISIAGDGDRELFYSLIQENNAEDKIIFNGMLQNNDLQKHYINSSIYLMTSRWEGMPLVLAEAMSFGLPIIAFEQSGSQEVLEDNKYGVLVENGNVEEMMKELGKLIAHEALLKELQKKSLERVKDFKIESIARSWDSIL